MESKYFFFRSGLQQSGRVTNMKCFLLYFHNFPHKR